MTITQEYLKELFTYNGEDLIWKVNKGRACIGSLAGNIDSSIGYRRISVNGIRYLAHRLVWIYHNGLINCDDQIDHEDQNRLNNRLSNLRVVDNQENLKNKTKYKNNTGGFSGVYWCKISNKWRALGRHAGKLKHLGLFTEKWDAICARKSWEVNNGFHTNHGNCKKLITKSPFNQQLTALRGI